jgi:hypothetical protein
MGMVTPDNNRVIIEDIWIINVPRKVINIIARSGTFHTRFRTTTAIPVITR